MSKPSRLKGRAKGAARRRYPPPDAPHLPRNQQRQIKDGRRGTVHIKR